jgi:hypothetical protein
MMIYTAYPHPGAIQPSAAEGDQLVGQLTDLSGDSGYARAGAGMVVAIPFEALSVAVMANGYADLQAFADINANDLTGQLPTDESQVQSRAIAMGAGVSEFGVTLAKASSRMCHWSVG